MRIVFVQQDVGMWGASLSLLALIDQLRIKGHSCLVLLPRVCPLAKELEAQDIKYEVIPRRCWVYTENGPIARRVASGIWSFGRNLKLADRAARIVSCFKPDLIHTNSSKTNFGALLAWRMSLPHVWHFREFTGGEFEFSVGVVFSLGRRVSCELIRTLSSAIVVVSRALKRQFDCISLRVPTYVVYNGILSSSEMEKTVLTPLPNSNPLTLSLIGRFDKWKQPTVALEAIRILRDEGRNVKLIVAGSGEKDDTQRVLEYIADHNLADSVDVRGFVKDIGQIYAQSHALLMCSISDSFGRATAEAMAYGRPVIGANAGATTELIDNETNGLLFRPGDPDDLASKIRRIIDDKRMIAYLGANGAEKAKREFTTEKYGSQMEQIFRSVINGR